MKTTNSIRISKGAFEEEQHPTCSHAQKKNKQTKNNHHKLTDASFKSVDSCINDSYSFCCSSQQRSDGADVKFSVLKTHRVALKGDLKNQADPSVTRAKKLHCCNNYVKINPPKLFHQKKNYNNNLSRLFLLDLKGNTDVQQNRLLCATQTNTWKKTQRSILVQFVSFVPDQGGYMTGCGQTGRDRKEKNNGTDVSSEPSLTALQLN